MNRPVSRRSAAAAAVFLVLGLALACARSAAAEPGDPVPQAGLSASQDPPDLRWLELSSGHFRFIFPAELRADALYCANLMEYLRRDLSAGFDSTIGRTTIVLHNQQDLATGWVDFFPHRSEWFHVAPAGSLLGTSEWFSLLAVHEGRHVAQHTEEQRGSVVAAQVLLGELGEAALLYGLGAPDWFTEGDAVLAETLATESGRGRQPGFQRPLRAAALEGDLPTWRQAFFGSYRRGFVDPYELGYLLTARIRREFGPEAAGEILRGASRWALVPGAFERNVRRVTGMSAALLYRSTLEELEGRWREQTAGLPVTGVRRLLADEAAAARDAAEYRFVAGVEGGVVAVKSSLSQEPAIVRIDGEGRERVLQPVRPRGGLAARGDRVVWGQHFPDLRWGNRGRTDLVELRLPAATAPAAPTGTAAPAATAPAAPTGTAAQSTGAVRRLTRGRILQSPAIAPDGGRVAAVEVLPERVSRLVVFGPGDAESEVFRAPSGAHLQEPAWSPDGRRLYVYRTAAGGKALLEVIVADRGADSIAADGGAAREILPAGRELLVGLGAWREYVLFGSDRSGLMNVYALEPVSGRVWQVTSRPYGVEGLAVSGDELFFSDGAPRGLLPASLPLRPESWIPAEEVPVRRVDVFRPIVAQEGLAPLIDPGEVPRRDYAVRPYRPGPQEILPYAWLPTAAVDGGALESVGLALFSTGMLQDRALTLQGGWDLRHGGPEGAVALEIGRWFPQLLLGAGYDLRDYPGTGERAQALTGSLGVRLPLTLDGIAWQQGLSLEARYEAGPVWAGGRDPVVAQALVGGLDWFLATRTSPRDLAPRWGLALDASGRAELPGSVAAFEAPGLAAEASAWLPGLLRHHSLQLSAAVADDGTGALHPVPRGYDRDPFAGAVVAGASAAYRFPLAYPDAGLGGWLHLPRLTAGAFGDLAFEPADPAGSLRVTAGLEVAADLEVLVPVPVRVGAQLIYRFEDGRFALRETLLGFTVVLGR